MSEKFVDEEIVALLRGIRKLSNLGRSPLWQCDGVTPTPRAKRQDHWHAVAILRVLSVELDEVSFLELDSDEYVSGRCDGTAR